SWSVAARGGTGPGHVFHFSAEQPEPKRKTRPVVSSKKIFSGNTTAGAAVTRPRSKAPCRRDTIPLPDFLSLWYRFTTAVPAASRHCGKSSATSTGAGIRLGCPHRKPGNSAAERFCFQQGHLHRSAVRQFVLASFPDLGVQQGPAQRRVGRVRLEV